MPRKKSPIRHLITACVILICAVVLCTAAALAVSGYIKHSVKDRIVPPEKAGLTRADCILVLGCQVVGDDTPSAMLKDRLDCAIGLYFDGASDRILMSGDHGTVKYDEVNAMKEYALKAGVPSEAVFMDHAGFSTYESIYRSRDVFKVGTAIIVTQEYHLYRALYIADRLGVTAVGVASDPRLYAGQAYRDAREILARDKDFVLCIFKPKPTFLGEVIPVSGNGDVTNDKEY